MASWTHGQYTSSAAVLDGLVYLGVTAYAKKAIVKDGARIARTDPRALAEPDNIEWEAELRGTKKMKLGKFPTREAAMAAAETAFNSTKKGK
jgi:hypothetical protein